MRLANRKHSFSLTVLTMVALALVTAGETRGERLPIKPYSLVEGLPHGQITRIKQDSQGFIWFCTGGGITRFDG
jgi:ligand-binding sensor domain-containing protein